MREVIEAEKALKQYASLQKMLSGLLFEFYGQPKDRFLTNVPSSGVLTVDDHAWNFHKHGVGITFTELSNGATVNAHKHIEYCVECFDAWRLALYFESMNIQALSIECSIYDAKDEESLKAMLDSLVQMGRVTFIDNIKSYTLSGNQTSDNDAGC